MMNGYEQRPDLGSAPLVSRDELSFSPTADDGRRPIGGFGDEDRFRYSFFSRRDQGGRLSRGVQGGYETGGTRSLSNHQTICHSRQNVVALAIIILLFSATSSANPQIFDFEGSDPMKTSSGSGSLGCSGNCPVVTTDVVRSGSRSLKSVVDRLKSPNMYRTEASHTYKWDVNKGASTTAYWSGFSVYIPGPYPAMTNPVYEIIYQLHASPPDDIWSGYNGMNPTLALFLTPETDTTGKFKIWIKGTNDPYPQSSNSTVFNSDVVNYQTNRWYDVVVNTRLDSAGGGFTKIWIDGQLVVNYSGMNYYRGHGPAYAKFGFYNGWRTRDIPGEKVNVRTIYHDEYRFGFGPGVGYDSVFPGGGDGLAAPSELRLTEP